MKHKSQKSQKRRKSQKKSKSVVKEGHIKRKMALNLEQTYNKVLGKSIKEIQSNLNKLIKIKIPSKTK